MNAIQTGGLWLTVGGLALAASACQAPGPAPTAQEHGQLKAAIVALYEAFSFDPGGQADWDAMRALFAEGATFYAPIRAGRQPRGEGAEPFITGFRAWIESSDIGRTGLHEVVSHWRIDRCGSIAHSFVTFDGVLPETGAAYSQGVDSIQWVLDGERWLVASFTSQYAQPGAPLPQRFLTADTSR